MGKRKRKASRKKASRRWGRWGAGILSMAVVMTLVTLALWARCGPGGCPDLHLLDGYTFDGGNVLLDRNGNELSTLHPLERVVVALDSIPTHVVDAFVAAEDHRFRRHRGVDWVRVAGAALSNLHQGRISEGASTITMQLARTVFPDRLPRVDRTLRRKLMEVRVASQIETRFSKDEILELYLNHVYLGGGAYGIQAASRYYFDRPVTQLTVAEAAMLAALAPAPALLDPRRHPDRARQRRDRVLELMERRDMLPNSERAQATGAPLGVTREPPLPAAIHPAPYFVDLVRQEMDSIFGRGGYGSGLKIHTTLDPALQTAAEEELERRLDAVERGVFGSYRGPRFDPSLPGTAAGTDYLQGAVVIMEVGTGDVLALVGGRSFAHSRFNRASAGRRPVGSAFKPFVYAAALRNGFVASQPISDRPFTLVGSGVSDWTPRNYDGTHGDQVGMREALVQSLNVPTARLAMEVGLPEVTAAARSAGVNGTIPETPAASLGTGSLSPMELTLAYSTLAGLGTRPRPRLIQRVEDQEGRVLHEKGIHLTSAMDARIAFLVTDMLRDVVTRGTGRGALASGYPGPAAGKTGTTQEGTDVWFVGYTPDRVATVWIGHDRPRPILPGATGGLLAAPVWGAIMARSGTGGEAWARPPGIVERSIDPATGMIPARGCHRMVSDGLVNELFLAEYHPAEGCPKRDPAADRGVVSRVVSAVRGLFGRGQEPEEETLPEGPERLSAPGGSGGPRADSYLGADRVPLASGPGHVAEGSSDQNR